MASVSSYQKPGHPEYGLSAMQVTTRPSHHRMASDRFYPSATVLVDEIAHTISRVSSHSNVSTAACDRPETRVQSGPRTNTDDFGPLRCPSLYLLSRNERVFDGNVCRGVVPVGPLVPTYPAFSVSASTWYHAPLHPFVTTYCACNHRILG